MQFLAIVLMSVLAAVSYGIVHDQFTTRICIEYFTVFHPPVFKTQSPTLLAIGWGTIATWWLGLPLGFMLAIAARYGTLPKRSVQQLIRPIGALLGTMALCALAAGAAGYVATAQGKALPPDWVRQQLEVTKYAPFMADASAHEASYFVGTFGGLLLIGWVLSSRYRARGRPGNGMLDPQHH